MEDLTGKQFGPYQIVAPLGEGGMAAVYRAYQAGMERYVALKVLPRRLADDGLLAPEFLARFQREARLLAQLQHPHILPVFDYGQADGYSYIVMPFVQSGTLTDTLEGRPAPLPRLIQVISQIGEALHYAHARGLIHRDVKPSNVLIDESGNCLLTDFGLARMMETPDNLTATGAMLGTPAYMSPEQGSGQMADARSDLYSLGVILYELATGRVPYKAETPIAVVFKHIQDPLPPARSLNPELPEAVERVILKALSKRPEDRYQTAGEMVRALQAALAEAPTVNAPAPPPATTASAPSTLIAQPKRLNPGWVMSLIAIIVVVIGGGLFVTFGRGSTTSASSDQPTPVATLEGLSVASESNACFPEVAEANQIEVFIEPPRDMYMRFGSNQPRDDVFALQVISAGDFMGSIKIKTLASGQGYDIVSVVDSACNPLTTYENATRPNQPQNAPHPFDTLRYSFGESVMAIEIFYTDMGELELRAQPIAP